MKRLAVFLLAFSVFPGGAYAHNDMEHIMGTITSITDTTITVKTTAGKSQIVVLAPATKYLKGDATSTLKEIKVGNHVVIHASRKGTGLIAVEVKTGAMKTSAWANHMSDSMTNSPANASPH